MSLELNRRDFLKTAVISASSLLLQACISQSPTQNVIPKTVEPSRVDTKQIKISEISPSSTQSPPTPTGLPPLLTEIPQLEPIFPQMVLVEPGTFQMGSEGGHKFEQPAHTVTLTKPILIGIYAITYEEYGIYQSDIGKYFPDADDPLKRKLPVSSVDWIDAVAYCNWLSEKSFLTLCYTGKGKVTKCNFSADGYRLPTEAEWEYAARGGHKSKGYIYSGSNNPGDVGWHSGNSGGKAHPVGEKAPNELGLFDMSGNRWEWCWDWFDPDYYAYSPEVDPTGPDEIPKTDFVERARRSSSAVEDAETLRTSYRSADFINYPGDNGLRLVRTA